MQTLLFQPEVFVATAAGNTGVVLIAMAIVAGASLLIGQSAVLFINHVTPARLAFTVIVNARWRMKAYSVDLRERVLAAIDRGMPRSEVVATFNVRYDPAQWFRP